MEKNLPLIDVVSNGEPNTCASIAARAKSVGIQERECLPKFTLGVAIEFFSADR